MGRSYSLKGKELLYIVFISCSRTEQSNVFSYSSPNMVVNQGNLKFCTGFAIIKKGKDITKMKCVHL